LSGELIGALIYLGVALLTNIHIAAPGFSTLVIILLFSNGLIFLYLGIPGEYIGQMFMEVKARPSFIIERTINVEKPTGISEPD
jgi:polyisoprenyl-phosphate glycosyltransferase